MSRSGYCDDLDHWALIRWRGAVQSAIRGKRGQSFLREMAAAMDALPEKRLVLGELEKDGEVCAIGTVGRARGVDMSAIDPEDRDTVAGAFGVSVALACEIVWMNDEAVWNETPEQRFARMRAWIAANLAPLPQPPEKTSEG
jgi:hypothetical protein